MAEKKLSLRMSLVFSFAERYTSFIFGVGAIVIVSRLLTPKEIGIFSVAAGLTTLANSLRTFGVSNYLVQLRTLTEEAIRASFTVNLIIAWILALALFATSWRVGIYFHDDGVGRVMRVLSGSFILVPFGITSMALLRRDMAFGALYKINASSNIANSCVTVGLAFAGFSYMSMAWASLISMLVMVLGCAYWGYEYRARGVGLSGWREVLAFGAKMTATDIATDLGQQSANLVVGRMLGLADAGLYSRGYGPVNMFRDKVIAAVKAVAFPAFAAEHRETASAPKLFLRALVYLTGISWPFFAFSALMAFPMIRIMFGDQWDGAVPLMRWLCGAAIVGTLVYQCNPFFIAVGRVGDATGIEIQYQLAGLGLAIVGAFISVEAVAASQVLVYVVATALYYRKMRDFETLGWRNCARALTSSAAVTAATIIVPAAVLAYPGFLHDHLLLAFAISVIGAASGWLLGVVVVRHPLLVELRMVTGRIRNYFGSASVN